MSVHNKNYITPTLGFASAVKGFRSFLSNEHYCACTCVLFGNKISYWCELEICYRAKWETSQTVDFVSIECLLVYKNLNALMVANKIEILYRVKMSFKT